MARPRGDIQKRVLVAARDRFLEQGVDGASLRDIARAAGTSIGMVYYYFPTKDDLFLAVVEEVYAVVLADLLPALDPGLPVEQRLLRLYTRIAAVTPDEILVFRLMLREALGSSTRFARILERFQRGHLPLIVRLAMDGLSGGTFDPGIHPVVVLLSMMSLAGPAQLLGRVAAARLPFPGIPQGEALSRQMLQVLLHGLAPKTR